MKHLLIILISFLLLSSPVIGDNHKGETLYRWGEKPDYKWMGFGDKETHPKYQGQVKDGKPNGLGVIIYPDGRKYVGEWKNGEQKEEILHGWGGKCCDYVWKEFGERYFHPKYQGQVKDGKPNGKGTVTWGDGSKYVGDWKDGKMNGQGTYTDSWGDKYVGEYKDGKMNGQGTYTSPNGHKYVGEHKDGRYHGQGTVTFQGKKWIGEFKVGDLWTGTEYDKDGNITLKYDKGSRYLGEYKDGKRWNVTYYDKGGKITGKVVNGKYIEQ